MDQEDEFDTQEYDNENLEPPKTTSNKPETQILGGFFIYRAKPSTENPTFDEAVNDLSPISRQEGEEDFEEEEFGQGEEGEGEEYFGGDSSSSLQTGEIVGMVLIKQYGSRVYISYSPIDVEKEKIGDFMTKFADTRIGNEADNNRANVFEFDSIDKLIDKLIYQNPQNKLFQQPLLAKPN